MAGTGNQASNKNNKTTANKNTAKSSPASTNRKAAHEDEKDTGIYDDEYTKKRKEDAVKALQETENTRKNEIMLFVYLAVALFLFVSNFGLCGFFGNLISGFIFGMVGAIGYIIPIYLFLSIAYLLVNGAHKKIIKRIECVTLFLVAAAFICQLLSGTSGVNIKTLFKEGAKKKSGGGVLLGGILVLMHKLIGLPGSIIVIVLLMIVGIIEVLDISIIGVLKGGIEKRRKIMQEDDYDDSYKYRENPNKDKNVLGSIEVLDETEKTDKKNTIVKSEEVHEVKPSEKTILSPDSSVSIDYFNITPNRANNTYEEPYDNQYYDDYNYENPNTSFFEKTDMFAGQSVSQNTATDYNDPYQPAENYDANKDSAFDTGNVIDLYSERRKYEDAAYYGANGSYDNQGYAQNENNTYPQNDAGYTGNVNTENTQNDKTFSSNYTDGANTQNKASVSSNTSDKADGKQEVYEKAKKKPKEYKLPPTNLLTPYKHGAAKNNAKELEETARLLEMTLANFGVNVTVTEHTSGPAVTRYELQPEMGVKVSKIVSLADDIKLNLAASDIRIEAPIPGKPAVGIEVPNKEKTAVNFRELIESESFKKFPSKIPFAVGKDIGGQVIVADIAKMPHLMVAGSTGSGKSVCINSLIVSILYKAKPDEVKLIMVDPKKVEFSVYNGIPHLLIPVVTDPKKAAGALNWAVAEMTNRYQLFAQYNVRNLAGYNEKVETVTGNTEGNEELKKLPQIVIIIDELADLMMVAHGEVEDAIVRLAQLARAAGIHMVIATQRPSADVITGLIKANVPSRIAMKVANGMESRIILDEVGAEKLLGNGDMMFYPTGYQKAVRVQGAFLSDAEIESIVNYIKSEQEEVTYDAAVEAEITSASAGNATSAGAGEPEVDDYFADAGRFIIGKDKASIGMLQRVYKIGFNRAARIMDQLTDAGVVGAEDGTKPRKVIMSLEEFENYCEEHL